MIPSDATHTLALAGAAYIVIIAAGMAILWLSRRNQERRNRHRCRYCGSPIIVRGRMRVCLNPVCGAQWRI